ncbi:hypothetical protein [Halalkalibacillus halophilus]|uniref:hypothetical protein n=1 Tax=Halalkalibacillus halophilus TaxID=392827 RepID=UPI000406A99A|nr:hypothetical protein [Halalkalibacillus halophilus]
MVEKSKQNEGAEMNDVQIELSNILLAIKELKEELTGMKGKIEGQEEKQLLEEMKQIVDHTESNIDKLMKEIASRKKDFIALKELLIDDKENVKLQSEYSILQNILQNITPPADLNTTQANNNQRKKSNSSLYRKPKPRNPNAKQTKDKLQKNQSISRRYRSKPSLNNQYVSTKHMPKAISPSFRMR